MSIYCTVSPGCYNVRILGTEDRGGGILVGDCLCTLISDVLLCAGVEDFIFTESADPGGVVGVPPVAVVDVLLGGEDCRDPACGGGGSSRM